MTERILSAVPVAGRIAGFNRQQPGSGIPLHSDGNNMWLTLQMAVSLPARAAAADAAAADGDAADDAAAADGDAADDAAAAADAAAAKTPNVVAPPAGVSLGPVPDPSRPWIRVGPEARHWDDGKCLVYDTTFEHETFNPSADEERVVLHVDFWNAASTRVPAARPAAAAAGALSDAELAAMQKVYALRERFLAAEGVSSVANQRLGAQ